MWFIQWKDDGGILVQGRSTKGVVEARSDFGAMYLYLYVFEYLMYYNSTTIASSATR